MYKVSVHLLSEWVEFNAQADSNIGHFGGGCTLEVLYITYSVMDGQRSEMTGEKSEF